MGARMLLAGITVTTALAGGASTYAVSLHQRLLSAETRATALERTSAGSTAKQHEAEAVAQDVTTKAGAQAASGSAQIRALKGKVVDLSTQVKDLQISLATATPPTTVVQPAPVARRTEIEALAYCRTLASQAFPSDTNPRTDPTAAAIANAYAEMMRKSTEAQCMGEQGYPQR